jgi:hypothetical protein
MTAALNMYIGRNDNHGDGKDKVTAPANAGSIVVDAGGNGSFYARSMSMTVDSGELTAGAFTMTDDDDSGAITGTALTMTKDSVGIYSKYVTMPATLNMKSMADAVRAHLCRGGRSREALLNTDPQPSLWVQANGVFGQDLVVNGLGKFNGHGKRGHALHAYGVLSTTDNVELNAGARSTKKHFTDQEMPATPNTAAPATVAAGRNATNAARTVYQDWFMTGNGFAFPDTYDRNVITVPGMVWQERTRALAEHGDPWQEQYVADANGQLTACYPGYRIWETATVSSRDPALALRLNAGGYATNTKHKQV